MAARSQTGPPGSGCEAHWILVLSTGRSGSTTILQMLNAVPFIELAGELTNTNTGRDESVLSHLWRAFDQSMRLDPRPERYARHGEPDHTQLKQDMCNWLRHLLPPDQIILVHELKRSRVVRSVTAVIMVGMIIITRAGPDRRPMPRCDCRVSGRRASRRDCRVPCRETARVGVRRTAVPTVCT